ncbi:MAG: hypothetical protein AAGC47_02275 [Bacteroidota bacterium]
MRKLLILTLLITPFILSGQGYSEYKGGLKVKLNDEGSSYFRLITWHQVWTRYNENNTGSLRAGEAQDATFDFGLRRSRFLMFAELNKRMLIVTHFGINNQNAVSGGLLGDSKKPQLFMHDVYLDYRVVDEKLHLGGGMHYWNGLSRMTSASTLNFMAMDAPIFNWPTIEATDQFARRIGLFAHGRLGKFLYQVSVTDPFETNSLRSINVDRAVYNPANLDKVYEGYFHYEFWDKESRVLPYAVGTYLGTKKVFNIGAGFMQNSNAMWYQEVNESTGDTATVTSDMLLLSVDAFVDLPLGEDGSKGALTAYAVGYFNYFGPNNVRNIGILNPSDGGGGLRGNSVPTLGTGTTLYTQVGYMLPVKKEEIKWQPYAAFTYHDFEGIQDSDGSGAPVTFFDVGLNAYLAGHHSKLTLNYRHRPDFTNVDDITYRPEITLQAMIYL